MATTRTSRSTRDDELVMLDEAGDFGDRRRHRHGRKRRQTPAQRRASLRNLKKARRARRHGGADIGLYGLFGDRARGGSKLRRPYLRSVVRKGRKLAGKHKIGHVGRGGRGQFRWVTRGGSVYQAHVTKKGGGGRKKGHSKGRHK